MRGNIRVPVFAPKLRFDLRRDENIIGIESFERLEELGFLRRVALCGQSENTICRPTPSMRIKADSIRQRPRVANETSQTQGPHLRAKCYFTFFFG